MFNSSDIIGSLRLSWCWSQLVVVIQALRRDAKVLKRCYEKSTHFRYTNEYDVLRANIVQQLFVNLPTAERCYVNF